MTVVAVASFIQANAHPAHGDRRWLQALAGRGGVIPRTPTFTDLKVSQRGAGANMSVDVADGQCYVTGTESSTQGVYHCDNVGVENKTITASNPTNARRDLIVARIKDVEYGVAVTNEFLLDVIAGTPAGSPVDPTVPANCIVLARVTVAANATSITNANITDLRNNYTAVTGSALIGNQQKALSHGAVIPCLSTSRPTVGLYEGMVIYETDTRINLVYTGSVWTWYGARGLIGYGASTSDQLAVVGTPVFITGVTTAAMVIPTGRNIRIEMSVAIYKTGADPSGYVSTWIQNGASGGGTTLRILSGYLVVGTPDNIMNSVVMPGTLSGTVTISSLVASATSFANVASGSYIAVYDMGPV